VILHQLNCLTPVDLVDQILPDYFNKILHENIVTQDS